MSASDVWLFWAGMAFLIAGFVAAARLFVWVLSPSGRGKLSPWGLVVNVAIVAAILLTFKLNS